LGVALFIFLKKKSFNLELRSSLNYRLFLVTVPRELSSEEEARKEIKDFITPFEQVIDKFSHYKKILFWNW